MLRRLTFLLLLFTMLASCGSPGRQNQDTALPDDSFQPNSKAQVLNGILLREQGGLQVAGAFLTDGSGNLVKAGNAIKEDEAVLLNLAIKKGWVRDSGKVSIGATQTIRTEDGEPVLSTPDLFAGQLISEKNAGTLRLKTVITKARPDTKNFLVSFRVWDKRGAGEVQGRYRLSLVMDPDQ